MGCTPSRHDDELLLPGNLVQFASGDGVCQARVMSLDVLRGTVTLEVTFAGDGCELAEGMMFTLGRDLVAVMERPTGMLCRMPPLFESEADRLAREARDAERMRELGRRAAERRNEAFWRAFMGE